MNTLYVQCIPLLDYTSLNGNNSDITTNTPLGSQSFLASASFWKYSSRTCLSASGYARSESHNTNHLRRHCDMGGASPGGLLVKYPALTTSWLLAVSDGRYILLVGDRGT